MTPTVEAVKEERPAINALSCKRNILKAALKATGEQDIFAFNVKTVKANGYMMLTQVHLYFLQRLGSCRSSPLVSW